MNTNAKGAMTVIEFLNWSRISRTTFYKLVKDRKIPICKVGKRTLVRRRDAEEWLNNLPLSRKIEEQ